MHPIAKEAFSVVPMGTKLKENASFLLAIAAKATKAKTKQLGRRSEQPYDRENTETCVLWNKTEFPHEVNH